MIDLDGNLIFVDSVKLSIIRFTADYNVSNNGRISSVSDTNEDLLLDFETSTTNIFGIIKELQSALDLSETLTGSIVEVSDVLVREGALEVSYEWNIKYNRFFSPMIYNQRLGIKIENDLLALSLGFSTKEILKVANIDFVYNINPFIINSSTPIATMDDISGGTISIIFKNKY